MRGASGEPPVGRFLLCVCRLRSTHSKLCAAKLLKKMKSRPSEGADFALGQTEIPFVGHALGRGCSLCGCRRHALGRGCSLCGCRWCALGRGCSLCGCRWCALGRGCSLCGSRWLALGRGYSLCGSRRHALGLRKKIKRSCVLLFTAYPEPGSNRHGLPHWCLRPARLPIPPSGLKCGAKVVILFEKAKFCGKKVRFFHLSITFPFF